MQTPEARAIGLDVFYPIVPDIDWLKRLLPLGIRTVQLRAKDMTEQQLRAEITEALALCEAAGCQLIVNDYWQLAIEAGADFLHLGQEDLSDADVLAIKKAGMKLGVIATNCRHDPGFRSISKHAQRPGRPGGVHASGGV